MITAIARVTNMNESNRLRGLCLVVWFSVLGIAHSAERPNFVFVLADDLGYGDLACYGREDIRTPHLDQLAQQGVRFTAHYANGAECTPTRTALLTGRYQQRVGGLECAIGTGNVGRYDDAIRLRETNDLGLPTSEPTLVRMLKDAGYATCISGKWHLGYEPKFAPHLHGFDEAFYCIGGGMDYFHYLDTVAGYNLFDHGQPVHREGYFTDLLTDRAIEFINRQSSERPFFLYVPFTCPHSPFQGPDDYQPDPLPLDSPLWSQSDAPPDVYIAMIERMDECVGRLLKSLADKGLARNTVVFFAGDNGGTRSSRNAPFSGFKGQTYEGGIRVPGIIRWPTAIPAGLVSREPCLTFDFTASMVRLAGATPAGDKPLDGIDIVNHIVKRHEPLNRTLYWRKQRGTTIWKAVRSRSLKFVAQATPQGSKEYLFDLKADPAEKNDLRSRRSAEFAKLKAAYERWEETVRRTRRGQP